MSTSIATVVTVMGILALAPAFAHGAEGNPETGQRVLIGDPQQGGERVLILDPHQEGGPRIAIRDPQAGGERRLIREGGDGTRILRFGQADGASQGARVLVRSPESPARLLLTAPPLTQQTHDRSKSHESGDSE